jgi:polyhydroxyalkanoate synthesis regulator phasin
MIDLIKKAMFTGIGMLSLSKDKVDEIARDFMDKGKLSEKEGERLVDDLLKKSEESRQELKKQIEEQVQELLEKMDLASKKDLAAIRTELDDIKSKLDAMENK